MLISDNLGPPFRVVFFRESPSLLNDKKNITLNIFKLPAPIRFGFRFTLERILKSFDSSLFAFKREFKIQGSFHLQPRSPSSIPWEATSGTVLPCCSAIKPTTEKIAKPATILVPQFIREIVSASLCDSKDKQTWNFSSSLSVSPIPPPPTPQLLPLLPCSSHRFPPSFSIVIREKCSGCLSFVRF